MAQYDGEKPPLKTKACILCFVANKHFIQKVYPASPLSYHRHNVNTNACLCFFSTVMSVTLFFLLFNNTPYGEPFNDLTTLSFWSKIPIINAQSAAIPLLWKVRYVRDAAMTFLKIYLPLISNLASCIIKT